LALVVNTHFLCAQVQTPLHVEPIGGVPDPLPAMDVPPELKAHIPPGFTLHAVLTTKMAPSGLIPESASADGTKHLPSPRCLCHS